MATSTANYRNTLCHIPPFVMFPPIKFFNFFLAVVMFPSGFLATDSRLLKYVWGFCFGIFSFSFLKNSIKNKVISININCSNCWPLSCSPLLKNDKKSAFWGNMTKGITVIQNKVYVWHLRHSVNLYLENKQILFLFIWI